MLEREQLLADHRQCRVRRTRRHLKQSDRELRKCTDGAAWHSPRFLSAVSLTYSALFSAVAPLPIYLHGKRAPASA